MPGIHEQDDCVFCGLVHGGSRDTWVLDEPRISALLDTNPVFKGHRALGADGTHVAINSHVNQSVPHVHAHVFPRTEGDAFRGVHWPHETYDSLEEMRAIAARIRTSLDAG